MERRTPVTDSDAQIPAEEGMEIKDLNRDMCEHAIDQWILGRNGERDRIILRIYLFDGITFEKMQRRLDEMGIPLSIDQLKKVVRKRKEELFKHI